MCVTLLWLNCIHIQELLLATWHTIQEWSRIASRINNLCNTTLTELHSYTRSCNAFSSIWRLKDHVALTWITLESSVMPLSQFLFIIHQMLCLLQFCKMPTLLKMDHYLPSLIYGDYRSLSAIFMHPFVTMNQTWKILWNEHVYAFDV